MIRLAHRLIEAVAPKRIGEEFRPMLSSFWLANLSDGILLAGGPLLVASLTRNAVLVALASILQRLPWMLVGLWAGVVADRHDRRLIAVVANIGRVVLLAVLSLLVATDRATIGIVLAMLLFMGAAEVFSDTSLDAMMPMVVPHADLGIANSRMMFGHMGINQLAGPPVGAALFALGMALPFVAQAILLAAAATIVARLRLPPRQIAPSTDRNVVREIGEGMRWLWRDRPLRALTITVVTLNVTFGATIAVLVLYALERLNLGEQGFGLLLTATAVGGVIGTLVYGAIEKRVSAPTMLRAVLVAETATHLGFALTSTAWVAMIIAFVFGFEASIWGTTAHAIRQRTVPEDMQGRVGAFYRVGGQSGLIVGGLLGGVLASAYGITAPYWFAFVGSVLIIIFIWGEMAEL